MTTKQLVYYKTLSAKSVRMDYRSTPFNLRTIRACRKIEKAEGCPYVASVAAELMRQDGLTPPARGVEPGTAYSYMAYCAGNAHHEYQARRRRRKLESEGWRLGACQDMVGRKVVALIHGEPKNGRIIDAGWRLCFMPARNRTKGYAADQLFLKAA